MNENNHYMPQLDGLRFIAVSLVMLSHGPQPASFLPYSQCLANFGVNMFFVLSGFLISQILIESKEKSNNKGLILRNFYIRRFLRIFPLYYMVVIVALAMNVPTSRENAGWLFTFTANIPAGLKENMIGDVSHFWSLAVEEQFYIFYPLLVLLIPTKHYLKLFYSFIFIAIASRLIEYLLIPNREIMGQVAYTFTPGCLDCFGIGGILAYLKYKSSIEKSFFDKSAPYLLCLLLAIILYFAAVRYQILLVPVLFTRTSFAIFCYWLIGKASFGNFKGAMGVFLNNKVVIYLGKISYGLYLIHPLVGYYLGNIPHAIYLFPFVTVLIASVSWKFYERPISKLKKYFTYAETTKLKANVFQIPPS